MAPMPFADLKARVEMGELGAADLIGRGDEPLRAASTWPAVASLLGRPRIRPIAVTSSSGSSLPLGKIAAVFAVLALLGGAGVWFQFFRTPKIERPATQDAFEKRIQVWKLAVPDLEGTADEHFQKGRKALANDSAESLREAMEHYRRSVLLDPGHFRAAAGYVEAYAIWNRDPGDREAYAEARDIANHLELVAPRDASVQRALCHLVMAAETPDLLKAREHGAQARLFSGDDAENLMALARSYIPTNADQAVEFLDKALAQDPKLKRAYLYRGFANERVGRYASAIADFERRLALDPNDRVALHAVAQTAVLVGAYPKVRAIYEKLLAGDPTAPEPRLGLAVLAYQIEGEPRRAQELLDKLVLEQETLEDEVRGHVIAHAAALARERGDAARAVELTKLADSLGASYSAAAKFQFALASLKLGKPDEARKALAATGGRFGDESDRALMEGRLLMAAGRNAEALSAFGKARDFAPRRITPTLFLAWAQAKSNVIQQSFTTLRAAIEVDPASTRSRRTLTDYYESQKSRLAGLDQVFVELGREQEDLALTFAAAGVIRYHQGDLQAAGPMLSKTLTLDREAMLALAYLSQIALDRGEGTIALSYAKAAEQAEKLSPLGYYLEGRALEKLKRDEEAANAYRRALDESRTFLPAVLRLGEIELKQGNRADAEKRFLQVFSGDSDNTEAKVALFSLGR